MQPPLKKACCPPHFNGWPEAVHVDMAIFPQFLGKLGGQNSMEVWREVPQSILQSKLGDKGGGGVFCKDWFQCL